jgi:hypothetical protein
MNKDTFRNMKPLLDFIFDLIDETEQHDAEIAEVRAIARKLNDDLNKAVQEIGSLKQQNHAMQLFIEEHVDEEKKKLIFKD